MIGLERSAIATIVDRTTRFTILVHLPRESDYRLIAPRKNGPPLGGYGAVTMSNALVAAFDKVPRILRRSLTWDRGKELSQHAQFTKENRYPSVLR